MWPLSSAVMVVALRLHTQVANAVWGAEEGQWVLQEGFLTAGALSAVLVSTCP